MKNYKLELEKLKIKIALTLGIPITAIIFCLMVKTAGIYVV